MIDEKLLVKKVELNVKTMYETCRIENIVLKCKSIVGLELDVKALHVVLYFVASL